MSRKDEVYPGTSHGCRVKLWLAECGAMRAVGHTRAEALGALVRAGCADNGIQVYVLTPGEPYTGGLLIPCA